MNTSRTVVPTTDGLRLSALIEGKATGPTLVLIHGYPDNLHVWDDLVAQLKSRYRIVRYDVRGAGQSDAPARFTGYALTQLCKDFRRVIDQCSRDAPVHLIGHDWGSIQGWECATEPALAGRIASFTSISGPGLDHIALAMRQRRLDRHALQDLVASWYVGSFHLPALAPLVWRFGLARHWHQLLAHIERLPKVPRHASQQRDGINGIGLYRANVGPRLLRPRQRQAITPVQLVVATRDPFVKPYVFDGLGHWVPQLTHAVELAQLTKVYITAITKDKSP